MTFVYQNKALSLKLKLKFTLVLSRLMPLHAQIELEIGSLTIKFDSYIPTLSVVGNTGVVKMKVV